MIVDPDFLDHWKTILLVDLLQDQQAPIYLLRLWAHCQNRKQAVFENVSPVALKAICRYQGDADELHHAMLTAGWIAVDASCLTVVGFEECNSQLFAAWENGKRGGRKPKGNPRVTQAEPKPNPRETDKEEKSREEEVERIKEPELRAAASEWIAYKREKRQPYKPQGLRAFVSTVLSKATEFGAEGAAKDIRGSMGDNYQGIVWGKYSARGSPAPTKKPRMDFSQFAKEPT